MYEQLRPILLFGETAGQRAKEINAAQRTLSRKADEFERDGMRSLFSPEEPREQGETSKTLSSEMRQLVVDVHAELPDMSWREIAEICYIRSLVLNWTSGTSQRPSGCWRCDDQN